jgi:3-oxoacyl-[acyl-carrier protein] reductase
VTDNVLITGANRGIGLALAQAFQGAGYTVVATYRSAADEASLKAQGFLPVQCDVSSSQSVDRAFDAAEALAGPIRTVVANAGITRDGLLMRMSDEDIESVIHTNLVGSIVIARRAVASMIKQRYGRIIFISSVVGLMGNAGQVNYSASKAGLVGAARSLAREVGSRGITVNVIAPGFVSTQMTAQLPEAKQQEFFAQVPLKRFAEPSEIAGAALFLASDQASYITGQLLGVDGGLGLGH